LPFLSETETPLEDQEEDKVLPWDGPWIIVLPYPPHLPAPDASTCSELPSLPANLTWAKNKTCQNLPRGQEGPSSRSTGAYSITRDSSGSSHP
jgi:hypothetical protein